MLAESLLLPSTVVMASDSIFTWASNSFVAEDGVRSGPGAAPATSNWSARTTLPPYIELPTVTRIRSLLLNESSLSRRCVAIVLESPSLAHRRR
jgi:hypothetical protein